VFPQRKRTQKKPSPPEKEKTLEEILSGLTDAQRENLLVGKTDIPVEMDDAMAFVKLKE